MQIGTALEEHLNDPANHWTIDGERKWSKIFAGSHAGSFSNGSRVVRLQLSDNLRWFERISGFDVAVLVDCRDHDTIGQALTAVLAGV